MQKENVTSGKGSVVIKALVVFLLIFVLMIPNVLIQNLVREREQRQREAVWEVSSKWAKPQVITGPIVTIPYLSYYRDEKENLRSEIKYAHFLPEVLNVNGNINPEKRYRGIYEVVVYNSDLTIDGEFNPEKFVLPNINPSYILYDKAFVSLGISDLRGIENQISFNWNDEVTSFNPGIETADVIQSGVQTMVDVDPQGVSDSLASPIKFSFSMQLKGSEKLWFMPVGKETNIRMKSPWPDPSFDGAFLPDDRKVDEDGFTAFWNVLHLNRNYPQSWLGARYDLAESAFGVNLIVPVDNYQKTMRSVKYALLFIILTFTVFFFIEFLYNKLVHPLHYALIGFALSLFYVLLLSMSEYMNFFIAYTIAGIMTIGLISAYSQAILKKIGLSSLIMGILLLLYSFIFTLIQLQDYALLMGSIGLFVTLAILMYFAKKVDWYTLVKKDSSLSK